MQGDGSSHEGVWRVIERALSPSARDAISFVQNSEGWVKFRVEKWQRSYEPSSDDLTAPVEGGLWIGDYSGLYPSLSAAKQDAASSVKWLKCDEN